MVSIPGLRAGWMVLNGLLGELRSKDVFIPDLTYADLRNAKMVIEYLGGFEEDIKATDQHDTTLRYEMETKIQSLREVLMVWAEEKEGVDYRKQWEERFDEAIQSETEPEKEAKTPISDIPREKDVAFFRIRLPEDIPVEVVSELAEHCGVLIHLDGDHHLQVSGKKECVRDAMKSLGELFYGENKTMS
ncbi:MAG: DUF2096 domain-containing protein [Candidatus Thorarchaeota archaeon]|nr:DUF2096 domain-containing protein [Candidatus Thorarchaeota archaeon]